MKQTDKIVQNVIDKFNQRSARGVAKYGTTLADNNTDDFLTHLQEELMDAVLYIEKLKQQKNNVLNSSVYKLNVKEDNVYGVFYDFEIIKIIPTQQVVAAFYHNSQKPINFVIIDEFTNPELFEGEPIFTDKRYAKIID